MFNRIQATARTYADTLTTRGAHAQFLLCAATRHDLHAAWIAACTRHGLHPKTTTARDLHATDAAAATFLDTLEARLMARYVPERS